MSMNLFCNSGSLPGCMQTVHHVNFSSMLILFTKGNYDFPREKTFQDSHWSFFMCALIHRDITKHIQVFNYISRDISYRIGWHVNATCG